jgi:hypothetical protein
VLSRRRPEDRRGNNSAPVGNRRRAFVFPPLREMENVLRAGRDAVAPASSSNPATALRSTR